jgi:Cof subfamily protein (haloacid dehalogenase superfamily)
MRFRLLAVDADGTLLDPEGAIRSRVRRTLRAVLERGIEVVVCTGRRYRTARPLLRELELTGAVIVQNGVLVKDTASGHTLVHDYLPPAVYAEALAVLRRLAPPMVYVDSRGGAGELDLVTERLEHAHPFQSEYWRDNVAVGRVLESLDAPPSDALTVLSCMADETSLRALRAEVQAALGDRVRTNLLENKSYRGHILEVVAPGSGKWPALRRLSEARGIPTQEILAVGDDENDAEMLAGAGLGVAMGNAVPAARAAARARTASNAEDGLALALERFLLDG